ncbi:helix-turn-helix domain-containing protein [Stigmatella hybrida]|uniref:helix-turn-helix domain-containing protein n=1 Tax=Stigmatella hybrida TaxID=394097 RepID=UPI001CDA75EF
MLLRPALLPPRAGEPGRLLTVREVAARLGVCRATVYRLCSQGALPHIRLSNAVRVDPHALERFIQGTSS